MNDFNGIEPSVSTQAPRKHSGIGIASFVMGLIDLVLFFVMVLMAVGVAASAGGQVDEHAPATIMLGLFVIFIGLVCLIGTGLGVGSVLQKQRRRVFGIIGLCLNGGVLLLILLMMVIGISHS